LQLARLPGDGARVTPIVTDLWRHTQPIIRYRLDDVLVMEPRPCPCGSPWRVIQAIEGRCDDICYFPAAESTLRPFFADTIRRMILLATPDIADYRAVQERPGHLRIHLATLPDADFDRVATAVRASVAATVAEYECRPATVEIEAGLPPAAPGGKRRRVIRLAG
jgi:phenylacetate-CoA ligase